MCTSPVKKSSDFSAADFSATAPKLAASYGRSGNFDKLETN